MVQRAARRGREGLRRTKSTRRERHKLGRASVAFTQVSQSVLLLQSSPEVMRPVVIVDVCSPLSLRNVESLLFGRGIDICHQTVRL
ncbi:hypothetical protein FHS94_003831 [Sphingomonas aerophila]|uniref:Uncharacterized protein n=1 Tax=Sphingomonas aerophila TaxID=1344948 RepID=A0A7W9EW25_9SPHN|nr:hypothetical protein [Sphingomonas aerophila]